MASGIDRLKSLFNTPGETSGTSGTDRLKSMLGNNEFKDVPEKITSDPFQFSKLQAATYSVPTPTQTDVNNAYKSLQGHKAQNLFQKVYPFAEKVYTGDTAQETDKLNRMSDFVQQSKVSSFVKEDGPANRPITYPKSQMQDIVKYLTDANYKKSLDAKALMSGAGSALDYSKTAFLSENERNILLSYASKNDWDKAGEFYKTIESDLNARQQGKTAQTTQEVSAEHPVLGAIANIGSSYSLPLAYAANLGQTIKNAATGNYERTDQNSRMFYGTNIAENTEQGITKDMSPFGKFLTQTGLSLGKMAAALPFGSTGALGVMATEAAGQTTSQALQNGATSNQALALGTVAGLIEAATEKIPLDNLFKAMDIGVSSFGQVIKNAAKQGGLEGTEEVVSEYLNNISDEIIMGGKSQYNQLVQQNIANGDDKEAAQRNAFIQVYIKNPLVAGLGGALSGGALGGGTSLLNVVKAEQTPQTPDAPTTPQNDVQATIAQGASSIAPQPTNAPQAQQTGVERLKALTAEQTTPQGMGAASQNFDAQGNKLSSLVDQYGAIKQGEAEITTERSVELPKKTSENLNVMQTMRTIMEAPVITNNTAEVLEGLVIDEKFSREVNTDKGALQRAKDKILGTGYAQALKDFDKRMAKPTTSKDDVALGFTLLAASEAVGDHKTSVDIITSMVDNVRASAQTVQAMRLLKKMDPMYQLYAAQRSVQNLNDELVDKYGKKAPNLKIDTALEEEYLKALQDKDDDAANKALDKIHRQIASQIPSTFADKWNAWRYMSMLTNPITHIKNIVSNTVFRGERFVKDVIATTIESIAVKDINRTKSFLTKKDSALIKQAAQMYEQDAELIYRYGKYNEAESKIEEYRTIFKSRPLEAVRKANMEGVTILGKKRGGLTNEDAWVSKPAYVKALASYLKAKGATSIHSGGSSLLADARAYAINAGQKAAYRDSNAVSDFVSHLRLRGKNPVSKVANILGEGILPFRRTPANVLVRGVEYSPVGFVVTLAKHATASYKGEFNSAQFIDDISANLTGTAVMAIGMLLAKLGIITVGGTGDDKEDKLSETQGKQQFAITIGGKSYSIPWLAPPAMALFLGVSIWNKLTDKSENGITLNDALKIASDISEPVLETSMLSSLTDFLDGFSFAKQTGTNTIYYALSQMTLNYLGQAVPTIGGRFSNIINSERRTYFTDSQSGVPADVQYFLQRQQSKIPGLSSLLPKYVDQWGRTQENGNVAERIFQNLISPGFLKDIKVSPMEEELQRLYKDYAKENEVNVLPPTTVRKYFSNNGEDVYMTSEEFTQYKITSGKTAYDELTKLTSSAEYKKMTDEEKADAVSDVYSSAAEQAKAEVMDKRGEMRLPSVTDGEKLQTYVDVSDISEKQAYTLYRALKDLKPEQGKPLVSEYQRITTVLKQDLTQQQKVDLISTYITEHDKDGNITTESLLPELKFNERLIALYSTSKDSAVISMAVPSSFTENKVEHILTPAEKTTFRNAYIKYFNSYITKEYTAENVKALKTLAYEAAKNAVLYK